MSDPTLGDDTRPLPRPPATFPPPPASSPPPPGQEQPPAASYPPPSTTPAEDATPTSASSAAGSGPGGRTKKKRAWLVPTAVGVVALLVGVGIGAVGGQSNAQKAEDELAAMTSERDELKAQVEDRAAQTEADQAEADRIQAEREEADRDAAEEQAAAAKAAADKAAADQAAAEKAAADQAAAAAAAEAEKNTIPGSGIFEIGGDKNAGTYRTDGPDSGSLGMCYYAILSSPSGSGVENIIDNNIIQGPGIVTLQAGQYFETNGCQTWTRE